MPKQEKILIRGLVRCAGWIFLIWGVVVVLKGMFDSFFGEPEANYFSPAKWDFVSKEQWLRFAGFEIFYGIACVTTAYLLRRYAARMPEYYVRTASREDTPV
ncbi:MAG: hypothetical protein ABII23_08420 [bacterium]